MHPQEPAYPQAGAGPQHPYAQSDEEARPGKRLSLINAKFKMQNAKWFRPFAFCIFYEEVFLMRKVIPYILILLLLTGCGVTDVNVETTATETTVAETVVPVTEVPTTAPTTVPTEPPEEHFLLTFVGDCTFGANPSNTYAGYGFPKTVGEDYEYPFRNVFRL